MRLLLDAIYQRFHYDFREYGMASVRRRLLQGARALGCSTFSAVQDCVLHDPKAFVVLLQYLTVQVSDFFRDPGYFLGFRQRIVPVLRTYPSLKLWIAGCSAGEELYSFAILLREEGLLDKTILYATDINPEALSAAEAGIYPLDRVRAFTRTTRRRGRPSRWPLIIPPSMARRCLTGRCARMSCSQTTASQRTLPSPKTRSCLAAMFSFTLNAHCRTGRFRLFRDSLCPRGFLGLGAKESLRFSRHELISTSSCGTSDGSSGDDAEPRARRPPAGAGAGDRRLCRLGGGARRALAGAACRFPAGAGRGARAGHLAQPARRLVCVTLRPARGQRGTGRANRAGRTLFAPAGYHLLVESIGAARCRSSRPCTSRVHPSTCCSNRLPTRTARRWWA